MIRYYCGRTGCGIDAEGDRCDECGAPWSMHREIDAATCGGFAPCPSAEIVADPAIPGRRLAVHGHHCDLAPGHAGPHHTAGCDRGAT